MSAKLDNKIKTLPINITKVILPLSYNYTDPGDLLYKIGDQVKKNQALTKSQPNNKYGITIHSPIDGNISNINYYPTLHSLANIDNLKTTLCVEITADPKTMYHFDKHSKLSHDINDHDNINIDLDNDFITVINNAGIVGLGGAGFPTGQKITNEITTIIINAMECEPPIDVDNSLIINHSKNIIDGCNLLNMILKPQELIIAIKESMTNALDSIKVALNITTTNSNIKLITLPNHYPNGYSKTLIKLITKQEISHNKHSNDYGILCLNVATVYAIEQAINHKSPLINRIITITGENLKNPGNYLIPIGTPISSILAAFDINLEENNNDQYALTIKIGGNYMGVEIFNSNNENYLNNIDLLYKTGIEKTTQSIIINYQQKVSIANKVINNAQPCIKCGFCEEICPMHLLPQQLYWFKDNAEQLEHHHINACIECGLCDTVCPSDIPLTEQFKNLKSKIKINQYQKYKATIAASRHALTIKRKEEVQSKHNTKDLINHKNLLQAALSRAKKM